MSLILNCSKNETYSGHKYLLTVCYGETLEKMHNSDTTYDFIQFVV